MSDGGRQNASARTRTFRAPALDCARSPQVSCQRYGEARRSPDRAWPHPQPPHHHKGRRHTRRVRPIRLRKGEARSFGTVGSSTKCAHRTWSHDADLINAASPYCGAARDPRPRREAIAPARLHRPLRPCTLAACGTQDGHKNRGGKRGWSTLSINPRRLFANVLRPTRKLGDLSAEFDELPRVRELRAAARLPRARHSRARLIAAPSPPAGSAR